MLPKWRESLCKLCQQRLPKVRPPDSTDTDDRHEQTALAQAAEGRRQLAEATRLKQPMAETAATLRNARSQNHFSVLLDQMLREGYGRAGTERR